jgi:hypothetical protein
VRVSAAFHVAGHVVRAFGHVREARIAVGHEPAQEVLEVASHGGVRVLLDHKAGGGVPQEDRAQTLADAGAGDGAAHRVGDAGEPPARVDAKRLGVLLHAHSPAYIHNITTDIIAQTAGTDSLVSRTATRTRSRSSTITDGRSDAKEDPPTAAGSSR